MRQVPGIHSVHEALKVRPKSVKSVLIKQGDLKGELYKIFSLAQSLRVPVKKVSPGVLDRIHVGNQGVVAEVDGRPDWPATRIQKSDSILLFALDSLEDPHNLGSILRTSWTLGVDGVIMPKDRAVGLTPAVEKVASGAVEHVPILDVTNLVQKLKDLKDQGFWVFGLSHEGQKKLDQAEYGKKVVLVVGAEGSGIRKGVAETCDELVQIPQAPEAHNLNASIAAAISAYEVLRQRSGSAK